MLTPIGKFIRKQRIDFGMTLLDMANGLDVSAPFLSAVETGKKRPPKDFVAKVGAFLKLDAGGVRELKKAVDASVREVNISLDQADTNSRELVAVFARNFSQITPDARSKIMQLLQTEKD